MNRRGFIFGASATLAIIPAARLMKLYVPRRMSNIEIAQAALDRMSRTLITEIEYDDRMMTRLLYDDRLGVITAEKIEWIDGLNWSPPDPNASRVIIGEDWPWREIRTRA